jgi:hypothetical protein
MGLLSILDDGEYILHRGAPIAEIVVIGSRNPTRENVNHERSDNRNAPSSALTIDNRSTATNQANSAVIADKAAINIKLTGVLGTTQYYASIPAALNPATVPIREAGNTETIYLILGAGDGTGHEAYSINSSAAVGLTPIGDISVRRLLLGNSVKGAAALGFDNLGALHNNTIMAVTFDIAQSYARQLQLQAAALETASVNSAAIYNLYTNNCAEWVGLANQAAGSTAPVGATPITEFTWLYNWNASFNNSGTQRPVRFKP